MKRTLLALLLAVPLVSTGGTAQAAVTCTAEQVTVVVQYLGGGQVTGCSNGDPGTGVDALRSAGFSFQYSPREPGFVCTIDSNPGDGKCMKPKYWSYWHASKPGAAWTYSSEGAGTYNPTPGSVEGWRFDCGAAPGAASRCTTSSPKPSPKPSPRPAPTPSTHASTGSGAQAGSGASPGTTGKAGTVSAKAKAKAKAPDTAKAKATKAKAKATKAKAKKKPAAAAAVVSASATPSQDTIANAAASQSVPRASEPPRRGTLPWWWGAIALVLIGGTAGAVTVVRRR